MSDTIEDSASLFDSFTNLENILVFYSTIIGNTTIDEQTELFSLLKEAVARIDPEFSFDHDDPPTAYEIFLIVEKINNTNPCETFDSPEGYYDDTMEFTIWDPLQPVNDTDQYPDMECVLTEDRK
jgi:hypothetical protein